MTDYDNNLEVVLAKVVSDNPNAPTMRIRTEIDGVKYSTGLWPMKRRDDSLVKDKNGNQLYKGKLAVDDYEPAPKQTPPAEDSKFVDEDIPF